MTTADVRFGIIGLAAGMTRCTMIARTSGARLVAVSDPETERGRQAEQQFGCDWHADHAELLDRNDVDVVIITTPAATHAEIGSKAAAAGKHVVVARPLEATLPRADRLIAACRSAKVTLAVDFPLRYHPTNQRIRRAVEEELFGRLILGETRLKWWRSSAYFRGSWRGTWQLAGGGCLINEALHQVDLLQWFLGPVERVIGLTATLTHDIESEDLALALLECHGGAFGSISATITHPSNLPVRLELHGEKGGVVTIGNRLRYWMVKQDREEARQAQNPEDFPFEYGGPANIVEDMIAVVREGTTPACDGQEGRKSLELALAVYEAARLGKPVRLPLKTKAR